MAFILDDILKDTLLIKSVNCNANRQWQYPITNKLSHIYDFKNSQSLLEISHRVSVHNWEKDDKNPFPVRLDPHNFDVVIPINTTFFYEEVNVLWFFFSTSMNIALSVYTGTYNYALYLVDLNYNQKDPVGINNYTDGMMIHGGFWSFYQNIQKEYLSLFNAYINKDTQVIITGISLGGAMSTIATLDLYKRKLDNGTIIRDIIHYSFASPRVFNINGTYHYNLLNLTSYRVQNGSDIIPTVPCPVMVVSLRPLVTEDFTHVDKLHYFDINLGNYYDNHILAYLEQFKIKPVL